MRKLSEWAVRSKAGIAAMSVLGAALLAVGTFGLVTSDVPGEGSLSIPSSTRRIALPLPSAQPTTTGAPTPSTSTSSGPPTSAAPIPAPVSVKVPAVGIASRLIPLGLNPDNTLEVPKDFAVAGWYTGRPVPGEVGPSIIAGHVDSKRGPAVFYRLREVRPGMSVEVARADGTVAKFNVVAIEEHDKDAFPTDRVYGPTATPQLRLITCGGRFDRSIGHYTDNIIVFAELAALT